MGLAYDSGWVPVASGTVNANVDCSNFYQLQVIVAASGAAGAGTTAGSWSEGAGTPVPWSKTSPLYSTSPPISGTFAAIAAPAAGAANIYHLGIGNSGTNHIGDWVPQFLHVNTVAGAASWARIVVIGK
jgi:hypothetical protein